MSALHVVARTDYWVRTFVENLDAMEKYHEKKNVDDKELVHAILTCRYMKHQILLGSD